MNTICFMLNIYVGLTILFTDPVSCAAEDLIKSFTVNGATSAKVTVGQTVTFMCSKKDDVANPSWAIQAMSSGEYLAGGSYTIQSGRLTVTVPAKLSYNGSVVCRATSNNFKTDSKNVTLFVSCKCYICLVIIEVLIYALQNQKQALFRIKKIISICQKMCHSTIRKQLLTSLILSIYIVNVHTFISVKLCAFVSCKCFFSKALDFSKRVECFVLLLIVPPVFF